MKQSLTQGLSFLSNNKGSIAIIILLLMFAAVIFYPSDKKPASAPQVYETKAELPPLKKLEKPLLSLSSHKSKIDVGKYQEEIISLLIYNTMGSYELPKELETKLNQTIDTVMLTTLESVVRSYKYYKINILASDTSGMLLFQKIE